MSQNPNIPYDPDEPLFDLDLSKHDSIAGPDFIGELRAAMHKRTRKAYEKDTSLRADLKSFAALYPEKVKGRIPENFTEIFTETPPLDSSDLSHRIRSIFFVNESPNADSIDEHFKKEEHTKYLSYLIEKAKKMGIPIDGAKNSRNLISLAFKVKNKRDLYKVKLLMEMNHGLPNELIVLDHYEDLEVLEWLSRHAPYLTSDSDQFYVSDYYSFLNKHDSPRIKTKLLTANEKLKNLYTQTKLGSLVKREYQRAGIPEIYSGFASGETFLDCVLETSEKELKQTFELMDKIEKETSLKFTKVSIDEFFLMNRLIHDHPQVFEIDEWSMSDHYGYNHPMPLILIEAYRLDGKSYISPTRGMMNPHSYLTEYCPELSELHHTLHGENHNALQEAIPKLDNDPEKYFSTIQRDLEYLKPLLENKEIWEILKTHIAITIQDLIQMMKKHESVFQTPEDLEKLKIIVQHNHAQGRKTLESDLSFLKQLEGDGDFLRWLLNLQMDEAVQFNALNHIVIHRYQDSQIARLKNWYNDPDLFEKAKSWGLFDPKEDHRKDQYSSLLFHYHPINHLKADPELLEFLIDSQCLNFYLRGNTNDTTFRKKREGLYAWKESRETYKRVKAINFFTHQSEAIFEAKWIPVFKEASDEAMKELNLRLQANPTLSKHIGPLLKFDVEKWDSFFEIIEEIDNSPVQEIQRLKEQLIPLILADENPLEAYRAVEAIFIKNNLPLVAKIFEIFKILYPENKISEILRNQNLSPYLRKLSAENRGNTIYYVIYGDLLKIHIQSGNRSLRDFVDVLIEGEDLLNKYESAPSGLSEAENEMLKYYLSKLEAISFFTKEIESIENSEISIDSELHKKVQRLRSQLNVHKSESIQEAIGKKFLKLVGLKSLTELRESMKESKRTAHQRGVNLAQEIESGKPPVRTGDFLKGIDHNFLAEALQNGVVSKEYLSGMMDSDYTPFDTDLSQIQEGQTSSIEAAVSSSLAGGYGSLILYVSNGTQFKTTTKMGIDSQELTSSQFPQSENTDLNLEMEGFELFCTGKRSKQHYGIRTGFPSTNIDYILVKDSLLKDKKAFRKICFEIAKNNIYIPLVAMDGRLIYSPSQFEKDRQSFIGLKRYDGVEFEHKATNGNSSIQGEVSKIKNQLERSKESAAQTYEAIKTILAEELNGLGLDLKIESKDSLVGSELYRTGSTARATHDPNGEPDFDLILQLDSNKMDKLQELVQRLKSKFRHTSDQSHDINGVSNGKSGYQIRLTGVTGLAQQAIDLDIGIINKAQPIYISTDEAIEAKFKNIEADLGVETLNKVRANIIYAKRLFKKAGVYKRQEGGLCGVGIENWILRFNGNVIEAFKAFQKASANGQKPLNQFKEDFPLTDPGKDLMHQTHDNFVQHLTEESYKRMSQIIESTLRLNS